MSYKSLVLDMGTKLSTDVAAVLTRYIKLSEAMGVSDNSQRITLVGVLTSLLVDLEWNGLPAGVTLEAAMAEIRAISTREKASPRRARDAVGPRQ